MPRRLLVPGWLAAVAGAALVIAVWWVCALVFAPEAGHKALVPSPPQVIAQIADDGFGFYWRSFAVTLQEAGIGYLVGNAIALALCALVLVLPRLEGALNQIAVISYCLPLVALGPVIKLILGGAESSGDPSHTATFIAGLSVFFTTVVGALLGLKASDQAALDVVSVYGGSRFTQLRKVRVISAMPHVLNALQIAVPAAFLGAVLGEYFGAIDLSVGTLLLTAQSGGNAARLWGLFLMSALVAIIGYGLVGLLARLAAPWSRGTGRAGA
ncbi:MAG: ABC transporter permease subunit [Microbacteriaceae bacterium]